MKAVPLIGLAVLALTGPALTQGAPPAVGGKPILQVRPKAATGCKFVGTVRGTKLWAGDCTDAAEIRGASPASAAPSALPEQPAGTPSGQKQ